MASNINVSLKWSGMVEEFDPHYARSWMAENWHKSIYLAIAYVALVKASQNFMKNKPPFKLTKLMVVWNALLTLFSLIGTCYTIPELINHYKKYGYIESFCIAGDYYSKKSQAFWIWLFHFSKALELLDTFLLVLRKRSVTFLHIYHHATVLLWCWFCYPYWSAPARYGIASNFAVHTIMYAYYLSHVLRVRLPAFVPPTITTCQIIQFVICAPMNVVALNRTIRHSGPCDTTLTLVVIQQLLYTSYFLLFAHFFYNAYLKKPREGISMKKVE